MRGSGFGTKGVDRTEPRTLSMKDWIEECFDRFGRSKEYPEDVVKFRCPVCGTVQTKEDFVPFFDKEIELLGVFGLSCIGRWSEEKGCDYAGGGLFKLNPVSVVLENGRIVDVFEFAEAEKEV